MSDLRLLTVHAHPDDEASKGAALVARYVSEGVGATLVCCTGGERGEIINPAMRHPEVENDLVAVRERELAASAAVIGFDRVELLGYHDSGMADDPANEEPHNFCNVDIDESTGELVRIIRRDRPHVLITYSDDQGGYPHPDHIRTHETSLLAFDRAADPRWYPDAGEPWQPSKLYYSIWSKARVTATHDKMVEMGVESPFDETWVSRFNQDHRITTRVDVGRFWDVRDAALLAHATQIDPTSVFWFGLPPDVAAEVYPYDDLILARSLVDSNLPEDDLFAGLR